MVSGEQLETVDRFESSTLKSPFLKDPTHFCEFYFQEPPYQVLPVKVREKYPSASVMRKGKFIFNLPSFFLITKICSQGKLPHQSLSPSRGRAISQWAFLSHIRGGGKRRTHSSEGQRLWPNRTLRGDYRTVSLWVWSPSQHFTTTLLGLQQRTVDYN